MQIIDRLKPRAVGPQTFQTDLRFDTDTLAAEERFSIFNWRCGSSNASGGFNFTRVADNLPFRAQNCSYELRSQSARSTSCTSIL